MYQVKFKMFTVIKFFLLPMGFVFALSLFVLAIRLSKFSPLTIKLSQTSNDIKK